MKKVVGVFLACIIFIITCPKVYAEEIIDVQSENVQYTDFSSVITQLNDLQCGEIKVVDGWELSCERNNIYLPQSAYPGTKTESRTYRVKRFSTQKIAFVISQTVSYFVNDEANKVSITSYSSNVKTYLSDYSAYKSRNDIINNNMIGNWVTAMSYFDIHSSRDGSSNVACSATVYMTGRVEFGFDKL